MEDALQLAFMIENVAMSQRMQWPREISKEKKTDSPLQPLEGYSPAIII